MRKFYVGFSSDLRARMKKHCAGKGCKTTSGGSWKLVYYESYYSEHDARKRAYAKALW